MIKDRKIAFAVIIFVLIATSMVTVYRNRNEIWGNIGSYAEVLPSTPWDREPLKGISENFTVDTTFSTHLPLIIIDTNGIAPPITTEMKFVDGEWKFEDLEGIQPYVSGTIAVIDREGYHGIEDTPTVTSNISIKRRGNSSMHYKKGQYLIKLLSSSGEEKSISMLNMGKENEWILNGSMSDKSMIRNYLAYKTASKFMPYTPDFKFCEVLFKNGNIYTYEGVYLFGENIKQGENRVNISSFKSTFSENSFLVRRDRYNENEVMLDTYASHNEKTITAIGLIYPGKSKVTKETIDYVSSEISEIEQVLYSDQFDVFSTYENYIDVDSFIDYFILNEFFASYDSGSYSTYMYRDIGKKLCIGPVWDYDGTMDNFKTEPLNVGVTSFQVHPWFNRLTTDTTFVEKLKNRYAQLRRSYLSDESIQDSIDEIISYIGPAQEREWNRWGYIYKTDNKYSLHSYVDDDLERIYRNSLEFEGEINRIRTILKQHGDSILEHLNKLQKSCIWETGWDSRSDIALLLVVLLLVSAVFINRRV